MAWSRCGRAMVALAVVGGLLAGCASPEATPPPGTGTAAQGEAPSVKVSAGTGGIRGIVVDAALRPLADARIALPRLNRSLASDAGGGFAFSDLAPGLYVIDASKPGYDGVQTQVEVAAGKVPPVTQLVLVPTPSLQPYVESYSVDMFVTFYSPAVGLGTAFEEALGQNPPFMQAGLDRSATTVQGELTWQPTTPTSARVQWVVSARMERNDTSDSVDYRIVQGQSPLTGRVNTTAANLTATYFFLRVDVVPIDFENPGVPPADGLAVVNQRFQAFGNVFHNLVPRADWTFVADGPYPL